MRNRTLLVVAAVLAWGAVNRVAGQSAPPPAKVTLDLACGKGVFALGEPVACTLTLTNHLAGSHLIYVPADFFPIKVPQWPLALLQFEVVRVEDGKHLENEYLKDKCVFPSRFSARDLVKLDIGRTIGWDLDLARNYNWQFRFAPGTFRVRALATIDILRQTAASTELREEVKRALGSRFEDAKYLVLDGALESNSVEFRIEEASRK